MIEEGFISAGNKYIKTLILAITAALEMAGPEDIVLVAGKGHEDYQEFADKDSFSDRKL